MNVKLKQNLTYKLVHKMLYLKVEISMGDTIKFLTTKTFLACEGHIVKLKFLPEKELADVTVSVYDDGRKIFRKHGFGSSEDVELFTVSSNPTLQYNFNNLDISGLEILYNCHSNM